MEANGYVSLEEIEEYNYVANRTFNTEEDFFEFYNAYAFRKGFVRYSSIRSGIMIAPSSCWLLSDALVILEFSSAGVGME